MNKVYLKPSAGFRIRTAAARPRLHRIKQPVDDDIWAVADLGFEIDGLVEMQSQFGMHLLNRFDRSRDRLANGLPRTLGIELLANASTEALGRFDLIQNRLAFIAKLLLARWIVEAGRFFKLLRRSPASDRGSL